MSIVSPESMSIVSPESKESDKAFPAAEKRRFDLSGSIAGGYTMKVAGCCQLRGLTSTIPTEANEG